MNDIIPAILVKDEASFRERLKIAETFAPLIQIDVIDGHFVPNSSWYDPVAIKDIQTPAEFELHLMVSDPTAYIGASQDLKNVQRIIWHIEVAIAHDVLINWCHKLKKGAGLAISPDTSISRLEPFVAEANEILVMGVRPGLSGQSLIESTLEKVREIHARWPDMPIGFDGGVSKESLPRLRDAGVTRFCVSSAIFNEEDPKRAYEELQGL